MAGCSFSAKGISVSVDLSVGAIADLIITYDGKTLRPLHRAPWIDEPRESFPPDISPGLSRLSGDFLCAPFSASDIEPAPAHGWTANAPWELVSSTAIDGGWQARMRLSRPVMGAVVEKVLTIRDGHPFLYQQHDLIGGTGEISVAHHPMTRMADGGRLSFSPKKFAETLDATMEPDPERGRYMFAYPGRTEDMTKLPAHGGGTMDLTVFRNEDLREDFVAMVEADGYGPGWTALARHAEKDLFLVLKNPHELPVTMLWFSNGGRFYAPWNGRHMGVLGIEDGRAAAGHALSVGDNSLRRQGVPTTFELAPERTVSFRHVLGAMALDNGGAPPSSIDTSGDRLTATFADGSELAAPFDASFLVFHRKG